MKSNQLRNCFLEYFKTKNHTIVPSAPIVQKNDPTLLFTNSGMVQFKEVFLGNEKAIAPRVADSQKCLRVSGKHNDLDDVGKDTYHHTMFEMLGNWSFNDYFKKEAIEWAWDFLTNTLKIPKENLYVTIFEGAKEEGLEKDNEAFELWKNHIAEDRILLGNKKDNFWEMGEQGPCGPCSEIHVDIRSEEEKRILPGAKLVNQDHPLVIEVWNLVFMENLRKADGSIIPLETKNIDTGMGFERLCMVMQGKTSNYDTDLFTPLIRHLEQLSAFQYATENESINVAFRVVVDHIRTLVFSISDGEIPSNNSAGYVIRRILRRALGYGYRFLNMKEPFLYQLVPTLVQTMGEAYPELKKQQGLVEKVLKEEEESFLRTLEKGLNRLEAIIMEQGEEKIIDGKLVYELKDTYGFPPDFSRIIAEENGYTIDEKSFMDEEKRLKDLSRKASEKQLSDWTFLIPECAENFLGHHAMEAQVKVSRYRKVETPKGSYYQLVFDQTPFYAEGGGQIGDTGYISNGEERISIVDTKKELGVPYCIVEVLPSYIEGEFWAKVDKERRQKTTLNHSATHLLHEVLREVLGNHVEQKGSLVAENELRFDFSHFSKVGIEELEQIEQEVNQRIKQQIPLQEYDGISIDTALEKGAMALFGEKYGEKVRMIQFGNSKELCGGSHVGNTAEIINFKVLSESSVAAGVRRIHAITGEATLQYYQQFEKQIEAIKEMLNHPQDAVNAVFKQKEELTQLKSELETLQKNQAKMEKSEWLQSTQEINGIHFIGQQTELDSNSIKDLIFQIKNQNPSTVLVIVSENKGKPMISVGVSEDLKSVNAGQMVRELAKEIKGGGGGQPEFATAGGKDVEGLPKVLPLAEKMLKALK